MFSENSSLSSQHWGTENVEDAQASDAGSSVSGSGEDLLAG